MILIVDDKLENRIALRKFLELSNFEVEEADSGAEALKKIYKNLYSLIILDVQMPDMDGFEVAETILGYSKAADTPILFLSAVNIDKAFITRGYRAGGVDYVTKPFDPDILLLKVKTFNRLFEQTHELKEIREKLIAEIEQRKILEKKKDEFLSIASHELRTPLTSMRGYIQLLDRMLAKEKNEAIRTSIEKAAYQVNKLNTLVDDLLDISRIESGKVTLKWGKFSMSTMLHHTLDNIRQMHPDYDINLEEDAQVEITGDALRIEQVFINFLTNAIKYSPNSKHIKVKSKCLENEVQVEVVDQGIGIPERLQPMLFDKFFRVEENGVRFQGLGIGLYICADIIERHRGSCGVTSTLGEGSTFYFRIPIEQPDSVLL